MRFSCIRGKTTVLESIPWSSFVNDVGLSVTRMALCINFNKKLQVVLGVKWWAQRFSHCNYWLGDDVNLASRSGAHHLDKILEKLSTPIFYRNVHKNNSN